MISTQRAILVSSPFRRQRVQLGGALLFAVMVPLLIRLSVGPEASLGDLASTTIGNVLAIVFGHYIFRSLTAYPGMTAGLLVLPSIGTAYAFVLAIFLGLRLDYSRFLFGLGFTVSTCWYMGTFLAAERSRSMRIALVPVGAAGALCDVERIECRALATPSLDRLEDVDAVAADFRADLPDEWERFLADCALQGRLVFHHKQLRESLTGKVEIEHISENTFGSLVPALVYVKLKQVFDVSTALVAAVLLLPVFAVIAIAIKLDSAGPVFFRQRRVGFRGRVFRVCKFRTMRHATSQDEVPNLRAAITEDNDPRVTRLGRFLRRTRLDELPQVFNIIAGQMSWIGPRPEAEVLSRWYEKELPFYRYRHVVRPGISGWAQVSQGHVAEVSEVMGKLHYDFYYVKYFSPWLDLLIIFKTVGTVFTGFGSK